MKSKQYLYNIIHIHSSQFLILMAQKFEEIMPDPDAIIRLRRDRLLGANLTGCDVNFCWMIQIQKKCQALWSVPPRPCDVTTIHPTVRTQSHNANAPVTSVCSAGHSSESEVKSFFFDPARQNDRFFL